MSNGRVLAVIPARGGSKGIPKKNILPVGGRPLIGWTIEAASNTPCIDRVVISTDDADIMHIAQLCGGDIPFKRPLELATDTASTIDVIVHAVDQIPGYDFVVLLQPTSPLRTSHDIQLAFEELRRADAPSCVSVCAVEESPYWMYRLDEANRINPILEIPQGVNRRQDLPPVFILNGAIYIAHINWLRKTRSFMTEETIGYVMPRQRSIDIDTFEDFAEFKRAVESRDG